MIGSQNLRAVLDDGTEVVVLRIIESILGYPDVAQSPRFELNGELLTERKDGRPLLDFVTVHPPFRNVTILG